MRKAKTNKCIAKRLKLTGGGKLLRCRQGRKHLLAKKSSRRKRRLARPTLAADGFVLKFKRLMVGL